MESYVAKQLIMLRPYCANPWRPAHRGLAANGSFQRRAVAYCQSRSRRTTAATTGTITSSLLLRPLRRLDRREQATFGQPGDRVVFEDALRERLTLALSPPAEPVAQSASYSATSAT